MTSIKPRILPRDAADLFIFLFVCLPFQFFPLFGIPFLAGFLVAGSVIAGIFMILSVYVLILLFTVWTLRVSETGIEFRRIFGSPKFLEWTEFSSIRPATRREVILRGWLWPLFPAREMTACLSARDHVRFEGPFGVCFFPPGDTKEFFKLVGKSHAASRPAQVLQTDTGDIAVPVN